MSNTYTHKIVMTDEETGDVIVTHHDFSEYKKYFLERWSKEDYDHSVRTRLWEIVEGISDSFTSQVEDYKPFQDFDEVVYVDFIDLEEENEND